MADMHKVLFIAYLYPPIANSGTRRSLSFVNHLPDHGWQPTVLTVQDPPARSCDPALLEEVRVGINVERAPRLGAAVAAWLRKARVPAKVGEALSWRIDNLLQQPDEILSWYPAAVRKGVQLHAQGRFDVIYASGWPWTAFLVARGIAKRTGCPFVLDFRDTWTPRGTEKWERPDRLRRWIGPRLERLAARTAAAIVTVTPSLVEAVGESSGRRDIVCITNGFEPSDFATPAPAADSDDPEAVLRISYTGIWRDDYGLHDLYRAVALLQSHGYPHLSRLKIIAAGFKAGPAAAMGVADHVEELGYVPHEQATTLMSEADLLYISVPLGYYATASLPGKLFEYMGSGSPILAVVPAVSEVARVLDEVGGAVRINPGDIDAIADVLVSLVEHRLGSVCTPANPPMLARYTRAATTAQLAKVFEAARTGVPAAAMVAP
jgi:glycosyltransferase involved in cell wall biosynthesis